MSWASYHNKEEKQIKQCLKLKQNQWRYHELTRVLEPKKQGLTSPLAGGVISYNQELKALMPVM